MKDETSGYLDYDSSLIGQNETTVIFFHAAWCPSCRSLDSNISAEDSIDNILILKADYDSETDLREKYEVNNQHTLVQVDNEGEMIMKWSGGGTLQSIIDKVQ